MTLQDEYDVLKEEYVVSPLFVSLFDRGVPQTLEANPTPDFYKPGPSLAGNPTLS